MERTEDPPKKRGSLETRARLMDAAMGVFARSGFDRATVDEIVRGAGFSKGAFYVHFESKEDLFWEILEDRISRQQEAILRGVNQSHPVEVNVRTVLEGVFGLILEEPLWGALFMEFGAHASRNERVRLRLASMYDRWREITVDILNAGRTAGRIRKDIDLQFMVTALIATIEGSIVQSHINPNNVRLQELIKPLSRALTEWLTPS